MVAAALAAVLFAGPPSRADVSVKLCNQSDRKVFFALGGFDSESKGFEWRSAGWWSVEAGDCREMRLARFLPEHLFVNANRDDHSLVWTGKFLFCVNEKDAFDVKGDRNCERHGEGFGLRRFFHRTSSDGTYTVNLVAQ
jgi:uncharacterized membrane protein